MSTKTLVGSIVCVVAFWCAASDSVTYTVQNTGSSTCSWHIYRDADCADYGLSGVLGAGASTGLLTASGYCSGGGAVVWHCWFVTGGSGIVPCGGSSSSGGVSGTMNIGCSGTVWSAGTFTIGGAVPPSYYCLDDTYTNSTAFAQDVFLSYSFTGPGNCGFFGNFVAGNNSGMSSGDIGLPPGGTFHVTGCATCQWSFAFAPYGGTGTNGPPVGTGPTNVVSSPGTNTGGGITGSGPGSGTGGPTVPPGAGQGSNSNLTGGQFSVGIGDLNGVIYGGIMQLDSDLRNGYGGFGTNGPGLGGTNGWFQQGSSNAAYSAFGTNAGNGSLQLGAADTDAASLLTSLGTAQYTNIGSGSSSAFSFAFCGTTLNLDPENVFPGIPAVIRQLVGWGAAMGFLFWFAGAYNDAVKTMSATELGGVPDMEAFLAGFGGNLIGVTSALVVPVVFIGLWIGVFTYAFGAVGSVTSSGYFGSNPFTSVAGAGTPGAVALYLLGDLLPISFLLSLIWTRLILSFTMPKLALISVAAGRFLFGK